ncbi:MAG TPA: hypothetical protein DCX67_07390 [Opitutae bacterium]|nr:hypothetical protein [Opitutae bacterium]
MDLLILTDFHRGSYEIVGKLFQTTLQEFGQVEHLPTPRNIKERNILSERVLGGVVFHNTLGDSFVTLDRSYNIALPAHEWSEYPKNWIKSLNKFDEIWTTTDHVLEVLKRGGLNVPVFKLPPALDSENIPKKKNWNLSLKPKFYFVGEPHFRKGHHLLIHGFMKAFPQGGEALLTIKTSPSCEWESPRDDIILIKEKWSREKLLSEYRRHDCFVSASLGEGLGLPVAEAIMSGLPVCTNFWGGHESLLGEGCFVRMAHEEILQPFSSDPKFFAAGQKCAFSPPDQIKEALLGFLALRPEERQSMTASARKFLCERYGSPQASQRILDRIKAIEATHGA